MIFFIFFSFCLNVILGLECPRGHICWPKCCSENFSYNLETEKCENLSWTTAKVVPDLFELRTTNNFSTLLHLTTNHQTFLTPIYGYGKQLGKECREEAIIR
jgi:hypothetical protein